MAENESIGGVSVSIVGDYAKLQSDLDQATKIAAAAGADISAALNSGANGADKLSGSMEDVGKSAKEFQDKIQALVDSGSTLAEAMAQVDSSLAPIAADAQKSSEALGGMAKSTEEVAKASKEAAPAVGEVSKSTGGFAKELLALGAAAGGIAAVIELGKAALGAADAVGDAALAMGLLSGNAEEAAQTVEQLRDVANEAGLDFPELLTAANRMTAFLGTSKDVPAVLTAVADSAAVMGVSVATASGSFERIVSSGDLSAGALRKLGLTMEDVAEVMGVSGKQMKLAFENMDPTMRMEVMVRALNKFKGAAKEMSDDSIGAVQRLKNQFFEALEAIGTAIEPIVNALVKLTSALMDSFAKQAIAIGAAVRSAAEGAKALFSAMKFDFVGYTTHIAAMGAAWNKGETDLKAFDERHQKVNKTVEEGTRLTDSEIKAQTQAALARASGTKAAEHQAEVLAALNRTVKEFALQLPATFEAYTKALENGGQAAKASLGQIDGAIQKASLAMEGLKGKPLAAMQAVVDKLEVLRERAKQFVAEDQWNKAAIQIAAAAQKYTAELGRLDKATLDWVNSALLAARNLEDLDKAASDAKFFKEWGDQMAKITAETAKLDEAWKKLAASGEKAIAGYNKAALEAIPITATLREQVGEAFASLVDYNRQMKEAGIATIQVLDEQIKQNAELLTQMGARRASAQALLQGEEDYLAAIIRRKEATGESAAAEIYGMEQVRLKQEALYNSTHALGDLAVGVERAMWQGWQDIFMSISDVIFEAKNFGDAMQEIGKRVAKTIVDELANYAFKALKTAIIGVDSSVMDLNKSLAKMAKTIADLFKPIPSPGGVPGKPGGSGFGGGGALGTIGSIADIATAISSIFGNFQFAAMNKSLDILVEHTLRQFNITDEWYRAEQDWFQQMFTRVGELWRDTVLGFEDVVNAIYEGGVGGGGRPPAEDGGGQLPPGRGPRPVNPDAPGIPGGARPTTPGVQPPKEPPRFPGVLGDIWAGITSAVPPGGPGGLPYLSDVGLKSMSSPSAQTYNNSTSSKTTNLGGVTIQIVEASNPRETARQVATTLRNLSPKFGAYAT